MKLIICSLLLLSLAQLSQAQYKPVNAGSELAFTIKNLGFDVKGSFTGFEGNINFDPLNPASSTMDVSIDGATVNTDNSLRDEHLKGQNYFDVKKYPRIRLYSSEIKQLKKGFFQFTGKLTIKDKTQDINFPFTYAPNGDGYMFKGSFKINRKSFGVGGTSTISDELEVSLLVHAQKSDVSLHSSL